MTAFFTAIGRGVSRAFGWVISIIQGIIIAIVTVSGAAYHNRTVRWVAKANAIVLVLVPILSFLVGVILLYRGASAGSDWMVLWGVAVLLGGTLLTFVALVPGLILISAIGIILAGLVQGAGVVYGDIMRPWRWLWTSRPRITVAAPAAAATVTTTRPARP
jgi:hypothetical protein